MSHEHHGDVPPQQAPPEPSGADVIDAPSPPTQGELEVSTSPSLEGDRSTGREAFDVQLNLARRIGSFALGGPPLDQSFFVSLRREGLAPGAEAILRAELGAAECRRWLSAFSDTIDAANALVGSVEKQEVVMTEAEWVIAAGAVANSVMRLVNRINSLPVASAA